MKLTNKEVFYIGGSAAFLVESTFQLMCARETIHEFGIEDYHIVMATFEWDGPRNQQMIQAAEKWGFRMEQTDMATVDFEAFFASDSTLDDTRKRYDRVFIGDSRSLNMLVIAADYARKEGIILSMDDGNATICELNKLYHISKPLYDWVGQYHWWVNKKAYTHKRHAIINKLLQKGITYANAFFTVFDDLNTDSFLIHRNSFHYLLSNLQADDTRNVGVVVIGTPLESVAKMYYTELDYILTILRKHLQTIKSAYPGESIVYIPHPRDINPRDKELCESLDVKYLPLGEPVESYVLTHADGVKAVYGYGSTALIVLKKILPQTHIENFEFSYGKNIKMETSREAINRYYRKSGMVVEHIVMPLTLAKTQDLGFWGNFRSLLNVLKRKIQKI